MTEQLGLLSFLECHRLTVQVDSPRPAGTVGCGWLGGWRVRPDTLVQIVHIMSPHVGGEIRGYVLCRGRLHPRTPCYTGQWPELDQAVAEHVGATVVPYRELPGGFLEEVSNG